jgi:hypothetical protein
MTPFSRPIGQLPVGQSIEYREAMQRIWNFEKERRARAKVKGRPANDHPDEGTGFVKHPRPTHWSDRLGDEPLKFLSAVSAWQIGQELNDLGGLKEMQDALNWLGRNLSDDEYGRMVNFFDKRWSGIGDWRA